MRRMNYIIGTDPLVFWGPLLPHIFWITNGPRRPLTSCSAFTSRSNFDLLVKKGKPPTVQKDCWSEPLRFSENAQLVGPMCNMNQTAHMCGMGNPLTTLDSNWDSWFSTETAQDFPSPTVASFLAFYCFQQGLGKLRIFQDWCHYLFSSWQLCLGLNRRRSRTRHFSFTDQSNTGIRVLTQALDLCLAQK